MHINAQINDFEGPLQFSPTKRRCHPFVRNRVPTNETKHWETHIHKGERESHQNKRAIKKRRDTKSKEKGVEEEEEEVQVLQVQVKHLELKEQKGLEHKEEEEEGGWLHC